MTTQELAQATNTVMGVKRERLNDGSTVQVWKCDGMGHLRECKKGMRRGEIEVVKARPASKANIEVRIDYDRVSFNEDENDGD